jgi:hypothetical protein
MGGRGVADLLAALPPSSLANYCCSSLSLLLWTVATACIATDLQTDFVAHLEGTVDMPRHHCDVMFSQLLPVWLLWLATWRHSIVFVVAGVVGMCCGGCGQSNEGCARWWLLVAMVTQCRWSL